MDWKTFIVEMTKALAWPLAITVAVLLLRDNVKRLLTNMRKFKYGETEITFEEVVSEAKSEAIEAGLDAAAIPGDGELLQLADKHPRLAIIEAWGRLEAKLARFISSTDPRVLRRTLLTVPRRLYEEGKIPRHQYQLLRKLRELRNRAAHLTDEAEEAVLASSAYEYIEMQNLVGRSLDAIGDYKLQLKSGE